ncbi:MAG TPA: peptidoglycan bridge formation glycyltransferase FemA/FemB family protein [Brevefilum sp.]
MELLDVESSSDWNEKIETLPGAHSLQTWQWGQVKSRFGWQPYHLLWRKDNAEIVAGALVLQRSIDPVGLPLGISVLYAPRGPLLDWSDTGLVKQVLDDLQDFAEQKKAIFLKIDPDLPLGYGIPGDESEESKVVGIAVKQDLKARGWLFSDEQIQFKNTVIVDLTDDSDTMLMQMKSKTRYNIRLAERRGVSVRTGGIADIDSLYKMYARTAIRDDFLIRGKDYYRTVWERFFTDGLAAPLIAEVDGSPVGAVVIFRFGGRAWYVHGMSLDEHREKMFNYRLQWEAMLHSKKAGCYQYDMWGAPDSFDESDPLWGVYRFKDGFGGQVLRTLGAWDYPVRPLLYPLYTRVLPRILGWMRQHGKKDTKRSISA